MRASRVVRKTTKDISEAEVREALERLDPLWDELFPAEQARLIHSWSSAPTWARMGSTFGYGPKVSPACRLS